MAIISSTGISALVFTNTNVNANVYINNSAEQPEEKCDKYDAEKGFWVYEKNNLKHKAGMSKMTIL